MDLPNHWIERTFEALLRNPPASLGLFPVWLFLGPRQVGKSSLLARCGEGRHIVNLDDLATRAAAHADPVLFSRELRPPVILDEIQYAPELLSAVKQIADGAEQPGLVWMTGSQNFKVMEGVRESLAGRVAILNLFGLSDEEKRLEARDPGAYFEAMLRSSLPRLCHVSDARARDLYLASYTKTYIERDVRELLRIDKRREFELFLRLCAARTACVVNYDELARETGVTASTVRSWLGVLEDSFLIYLAKPEHRNRSKRLTKSPKLYFLDAGLAAHLSGWHSADAVRYGPQAGALFETHMLTEILKAHRHRAMEVEVRFWRTRDGEEIDFLVESLGEVRPVEVKVGMPSARALPRLDRIAESHWRDGQVVTLALDEARTLSERWRALPPHELDLAVTL